MLHQKNENREEVWESYLNYFWNNSEEQKGVVLEVEEET
jgi:hypothetical protein